jgi:hypothetical protein
MSGNVGASTSHSPKGLHGLYRDSFTIGWREKWRDKGGSIKEQKEEREAEQK